MSGKEEVTVERLEEEIAKILEGADLKTTSSKKVRLALEKIFADLKPWVKKIDEIVMDQVEKMSINSDADIDEDISDEEDEKVEEVQSIKEEAEVKKPRIAAAIASIKKEDSEDDDDSEEEEEVKKPRRAPAAASKKKEDSEDDDDSEEEQKKKPARKPNTRKRKSSADDNGNKPAKSAKGKKGGGGKGNGYTKPYKLSPALSELMGEAEMPRHEVVRRVWAIIKEKNLYDPSNKQFAICDEALYSVIGVKKFRTFGMMKYLKNHFIT